MSRFKSPTFLASEWLVRKTDARRATRIDGADVDAMQRKFSLTDEESQEAHQWAEDELADRCDDHPLDIAERQDREDRCAGLDAPWWAHP